MSEQFSPELQLALALSHPEGLQTLQVTKLSKQHINWPKFIALCHRQHISDAQGLPDIALALNLAHQQR